MIARDNYLDAGGRNHREQSASQLRLKLLSQTAVAPFGNQFNRVHVAFECGFKEALNHSLHSPAARKIIFQLGCERDLAMPFACSVAALALFPLVRFQPRSMFPLGAVLLQTSFTHIAT